MKQGFIAFKLNKQPFPCGKPLYHKFPLQREFMIG
jgi:hypothetical protein